MKYSPTPQKKQAATVASVLLISAVTAFMLSGPLPIPPVIFQLVALILGTAGTYVAVRYLFTSFTYSITGGRDGAVFRVDKAQGKRDAVTECLLPLNGLFRVDEYTDEYRGMLKREYPRTAVYHYTVSMYNARRHALLFRDGEGYVCAVIEADGAMLSELSGYATGEN